MDSQAKKDTFFTVAFLMLRAYGLDFLHRAELLIIQNLIKVHNNFIQQSTDMEGGIIATEERTARKGHPPPPQPAAIVVFVMRVDPTFV
jgi:hypothetical protein